MNGSLARNAALLAGLKACDESAVDIVVCPPYPYLAQATDALQATPIAVGAPYFVVTRSIISAFDGCFSLEKPSRREM